MALFTLELIVESLRGSAGAFRADTAANTGDSQPVLGLRLLDLPPALIEAPSGETYGSCSDSLVTFGGRGKALVFELPESLTNPASARHARISERVVTAEPLALWVMALARSVADERIHEHGEFDRGHPSAVLLASACVDLQGEIQRAIATNAMSATDLQQAPPSTTRGPFAFRRCSFNMTPTRDSSCNLTIDCYFRLYAGGQRRLVGSELLLEPSAVVPRHEHGDVLGAGPIKPASTGLQDEFGSEEKFAVAGKQEVDVFPEIDHAAAAASANQSYVAADLPSPASHVRSQPLPSRTNAIRSPLRGTVAANGVFFPDEITLVGGFAENDGDGVAGTENMHEATAAMGNSRQQAPAVASSLPLVAELLRELWQIRSVT